MFSGTRAVAEPLAVARARRLLAVAGPGSSSRPSAGSARRSARPARGRRAAAARGRARRALRHRPDDAATGARDPARGRLRRDAGGAVEAGRSYVRAVRCCRCAVRGSASRLHRRRPARSGDYRAVVSGAAAALAAERADAARGGARCARWSRPWRARRPSQPSAATTHGGIWRWRRPPAHPPGARRDVRAGRGRRATGPDPAPATGSARLQRPAPRDPRSRPRRRPMPRVAYGGARARNGDFLVGLRLGRVEP